MTDEPLNLRTTHARQDHPPTGVIVRAQVPGGSWHNVDLAHLDRASLDRWLAADLGRALRFVHQLLGHAPEPTGPRVYVVVGGFSHGKDILGVYADREAAVAFARLGTAGWEDRTEGSGYVLKIHDGTTTRWYAIEGHRLQGGEVTS